MKFLLSVTLTAALVAGCSGIRTVDSDVSSFGDWPSERRPGTYAFDRLPSQQAQAAETDRLEAAARPALEKAGFQPASAAALPDVLVQVGARSTRTDRLLWDDPLWWRGGFGYGYGRHRGPWLGPAWTLSPGYDVPRYDREVAVLVRDRVSGKPLFESRASSEGRWQTDSTLIGAMFEAALMDFPRQGVNPRRVIVTLPPS